MASIQTGQRLYSFEEYCTYIKGMDERYELIEGKLELMTPPTFRHLIIAKYLEHIFDREIQKRALPLLCLREAGVRTGWRKSRLTDLYIIAKDTAIELLDRTAIVQTPPLLVVEIVSPDSIITDYRYKRSEYAALEIPEYWIVDPKKNQITVLVFEEGLYEETVYSGEENISSRLFTQLNLTATQVFTAGDLKE